MGVANKRNINDTHLLLSKFYDIGGSFFYSYVYQYRNSEKPVGNLSNEEAKVAENLIIKESQKCLFNYKTFSRNSLSLNHFLGCQGLIRVLKSRLYPTDN